MTVTLNFNHDIEAGLLAQARASGMTVEEYLLSMVEVRESEVARATSGCL